MPPCSSSSISLCVCVVAVDTTDSLRDRVREPLRHFLASAKDLIVPNRRCQDVSGSITNIMQVRATFTAIY